jgi:hypothetical protein
MLIYNVVYKLVFYNNEDKLLWFLFELT